MALRMIPLEEVIVAALNVFDSARVSDVSSKREG
jgi:hypothetical protein